VTHSAGVQYCTFFLEFLFGEFFLGSSVLWDEGEGERGDDGGREGGGGRRGETHVTSN
jgi:hypothetical protein